MTEEKASDEVVKSEVGVAESTSLRPVDQIVLEILRREPGLTVPDLMARLEVTATAVRHRVDRLAVEQHYYVDRKHCTAVGRGRGAVLGQSHAEAELLLGHAGLLSMVDGHAAAR